MPLSRLNVTVAAIMVFSGAGAFACSSSAPDEAVGTSEHAINGVSCSQVVLTASRTYDPKGWTDGAGNPGGRMPFTLPAEIPVTAGSPGNHRATLTFGDGGRTVECTYKGNGSPSDDDTDDDDDVSGQGGTAYVFKSCKGKNAKNLAPGAALTADSFALHVKNGDRNFGTTTASIVIDETRPCDPATRGVVAFHDRVLPGLDGNGRACSDCHMDSNSFQLSPANAEARYQTMISSGIDDPLFRPIDADDFDTNGDLASDYSNLRNNGLVRIRMTLPANIRVLNPSSCFTNGVPAPCQTATTYTTSGVTDVWRATPSVINVAITGADTQLPAWPRFPNKQGGYQLDGRIDTLQNQALAAFTTHAQVAVAPASGMLDDIAAYERTLNTDPEPALNELETAGKAVFTRACAQCHGGAGTTTPVTQTPPVVRFHDVLTTCPRPVDNVSPARFSIPGCSASVGRNARTYEITYADGFKQRRTTSDPGRALLTGFVFSGQVVAGVCAHAPCGAPGADDWQKLEIAPLHGIAKTAPYFHNNSAATLEDVVIHYEEFFKRVSALNPPPALPPILTTDNVNRDRPNTPAEREALVAYLNKL